MWMQALEEKIKFNRKPGNWEGSSKTKVSRMLPSSACDILALVHEFFWDFDFESIHGAYYYPHHTE